MCYVRRVVWQLTSYRRDTAFLERSAVRRGKIKSNEPTLIEVRKPARFLSLSLSLHSERVNKLSSNSTFCAETGKHLMEYKSGPGLPYARISEYRGSLSQQSEWSSCLLIGGRFSMYY